MNKKTSKSPVQGWISVFIMAIALLMASPLAAYAQDDSIPPCDGGCTSVSGTVRTCAGVGLAGVSVVLVGESTGFTTTKVTGPSGTFFSGLMPIDVYIVTPTPTTGYFFNPQVVNAAGSSVSFTRYPRDNRANFDGDCRTDVAVFKATANGLWASLNSSNGASVNYNFGTTGDIATPGDYNADGKTDYAVFRPSEGNWYIETDKSTPLVFDVMHFGLSGDIPVARDYDGDAITDVAVFRPSDNTWYIQGSSAGFRAVQWGASGDRVTPGDYDGDNKDDVAVYRPSEGKWYVLRSSDGGYSVTQFGVLEDAPVQADYDGDGRTDIAVYRPSTGYWYILGSSMGWRQESWGLSTDRVTPGDYTGDGRADIAVQRPTEGIFYIRDLVTCAITTSPIFSSDFPVAAAYLTPLY
jgi:hypothetical protein